MRDIEVVLPLPHAPAICEVPTARPARLDRKALLTPRSLLVALRHSPTWRPLGRVEDVCGDGLSGGHRSQLIDYDAFAAYAYEVGPKRCRALSLGARLQ